MIFTNTARKGFTLIELLVVIAIIGILASVVLASLNSARTKSRDAAQVADLKQVQNALELYAYDNGGYPAGSGAFNSTNEGSLNPLTPTYMGTLPPLRNLHGFSYYSYTSAGATCSTAPCASYTLFAWQESLNNWCEISMGIENPSYQNCGQ